MFEHHSIIIDNEELKRYSQNWHRPAVAKDLERYEYSHQNEENESEDTKVRLLYEPRGAQIEALCALEDTRAEGGKKSIGAGCNWCGVRHIWRHLIPKVMNGFYLLLIGRNSETSCRFLFGMSGIQRIMVFLQGKKRVTDKSVIFASVATLGRSEYLSEKYFAPDYFQYLVIDEFHHAVNEQYQRIVKYFKPQFLLGLTATPERMDGRNIYEICDYNVPYEISLKDAINKGMLVPFHYYGIYDDTDYSGLHLIRGPI